MPRYNLLACSQSCLSLESKNTFRVENRTSYSALNQKVVSLNYDKISPCDGLKIPREPSSQDLCTKKASLSFPGRNALIFFFSLKVFTCSATQFCQVLLNNGTNYFAAFSNLSHNL